MLRTPTIRARVRGRVLTEWSRLKHERKKRQTGDAGQGGAKFDGPTPNGPGWCHEEAMLCSHLPADFFPHTTSDRPLPRAYLAQGIVQIAAFCPPARGPHSCSLPMRMREACLGQVQPALVPPPQQAVRRYVTAPSSAGTLMAPMSHSPRVLCGHGHLPHSPPTLCNDQGRQSRARPQQHT